MDQNRVKLVPIPPAFTDFNWSRMKLIAQCVFRVASLAQLSLPFYCRGLDNRTTFAIVMGILGIIEFLPALVMQYGLLPFAAFFLGSTWMPVPHWIFMLIVIGLHLIFEQFDLNYLIPRIVGRRVHLPTLVVIFGIVAGAILAGIIGIPLAAPTIASLRVFGRYIFANLFDMDWTQVSAVQQLPPPKLYWWQSSQRREKLS
jgi:predicted PurR-regulated permease PerM